MNMQLCRALAAPAFAALAALSLAAARPQPAAAQQALYVGDAGAGAIVEFTSSGTASTFARDPSNGSVLFAPLSLAFDSAGNLCAANEGSSTIEKFTPSGIASTFAADPGDKSVLSSPFGLAFDSAGNLYAANEGTSTIEKFAPDGVGSVFASGLSGPVFLAFSPAPTPEPSSFAALATGILGLGALTLKARKRRSA